MSVSYELIWILVSRKEGSTGKFLCRSSNLFRQADVWLDAASPVARFVMSIEMSMIQEEAATAGLSMQSGSRKMKSTGKVGNKVVLPCISRSFGHQEMAIPQSPSSESPLADESAVYDNEYHSHICLI